MNKRINILDIPIDAVTYDDVLERIRQAVEKQEKCFITTPNPEILVLASENRDYKKVLQAATMALPDGTGILWAAHYLSLPRLASFLSRFWQLKRSFLSFFWNRSRADSLFPGRVTGTDLFYRVIELSQRYGWKIFLLGARPGIAEIAIQNLQNKFPQALFVGAYAGSPSAEEEAEIRHRIDHVAPDILFVAYGHPGQEFWLARNLKKLSTVRVGIGVGGAFDFAAGKAKRAPAAFQKAGLEWLWRLAREPRRLKRIWRATAGFIRLIFRSKYPRET